MALWIGDSPHCLYFLFLASSCGSHPGPGGAQLSVPHTLAEPQPTNGCVLREWTTIQRSSDLSQRCSPLFLPSYRPSVTAAPGLWVLPCLLPPYFCCSGGFLVQKASPIALTSPAPSPQLPLAPGPGVFILLSCKPDSYMS